MDREKIISENIKKIESNISLALQKANRENDVVSLMAVTKTQTPKDVNLAVKHGVTLLGENRVQEFLEKASCYQAPEK